MPTDRDKLKAACLLILEAIGEDTTRPDLADTPRRFADAWAEFADFEPGRIGTAFDHSAEGDQIVVVSGMRVWSMCEHHLLPFWCDVAIGYHPAGRVLGLSKFARIAQEAAHRLQTQERLTAQVADRVAELTGSDDVAVVGSGQHLCMCTRGVRTPGTMTTSVVRGLFRESAAARGEFLTLAGLRA
jgi:GTP cyclohydrolase IA